MSCGSARLSDGASSEDCSSSLSSPASPSVSSGLSSASSASSSSVVALRVRILAQLVAVAEIGDHPPREAGEGLLVVQHVLEPLEGAAGMAVEMPAPELHARSPPRCGSARPVARCRTRYPAACASGACAGSVMLAIAHAPGLVGDPRVDVARGPRHRPGAHAPRSAPSPSPRRAPSPSRPPAHSAGGSRRRGSAGGARRRPPCRAPAAPRRASSAASPAAAESPRPRSPAGRPNRRPSAPARPPWRASLRRALS